MTEPVFFFHDGLLWHRTTFWERDQMERQARFFETPAARCPDLAAECRRALAEYDDFYAENEDAELQYITETAA